MTTPRTLILAVAASGAFGGTIGSVVTAATQSQASPSAIAAAVQRVQDSSAEATLRRVDSDLATLNAALQFDGHSAGYELFAICEHTRPSLGTGLEC